MWRKATHYRLASFATLVVGASIALLTGVQATPLDFGPPDQSGNIPFVRIGAAGGFQLWLPPQGQNAAGITVNNVPPQTGPASVSGLSGGNYTFPVSAPTVNAQSFTNTGAGVFNNTTLCLTFPGLFGCRKPLRLPVVATV